MSTEGNQPGQGESPSVRVREGPALAGERGPAREEEGRGGEGGRTQGDSGKEEFPMMRGPPSCHALKSGGS